ncbi:hypothetical protein [Nocardioides sp. zg-1228]|nr:hypothetical protein [Nocardioides sp. zg-1228]MBC2931500.1 hypothetical protein [Nocardioides sp. zg-1228]QSF57105.1 hypothetical protein JX575_16270 [Nocardioides sp. zg-1228]
MLARDDDVEVVARGSRGSTGTPMTRDRLLPELAEPRVLRTRADQPPHA